MKIIVRELNGCHNNIVYYTDIDSLHIEKKYWDVFEKAQLVGSGLRRGKFDYGDEKVIFFGLF